MILPTEDDVAYHEAIPRSSYKPRALILSKSYSFPSIWDFDKSIADNVQNLEGQWCELSISHDSHYAVATVLAVKDHT